MNKNLKRVLIAVVTVALLAGGAVACASTVGTRQNAEGGYGQAPRGGFAERESLASEAEQVPYRQVQAPGGGRGVQPNGRLNTRPGGFNSDRGFGGYIDEYAEIIGVEPQDVLEAMQDRSLDLWEMAEEDGNFDALKAAALESLDEEIAEADNELRLERLQETRDEIAAMTTADDYCEPDGFRGGYGNPLEEQIG